MVDERDLAEEVAAFQRIHLPTLLQHVGGSLDQHEELAPGRALAGQLLAFLEVDLVRDAGDRRQLLLGALREQRCTLEKLCFRVFAKPHADEFKAMEWVRRNW